MLHQLTVWQTDSDRGKVKVGCIAAADDDRRTESHVQGRYVRVCTRHRRPECLLLRRVCCCLHLLGQQQHEEVQQSDNVRHSLVRDHDASERGRPAPADPGHANNDLPRVPGRARCGARARSAVDVYLVSGIVKHHSALGPEGRKVVVPRMHNNDFFKKMNEQTNVLT